jgi:hypothetical protein
METAMDNIMNRSVGTNWTTNNLKTLLDWLLIGAYYIECLELSIVSSRRTLRYNIILGLILSTLTGTMNLTQFNLIDNYAVNFGIKVLLTLMSFIIAINTGRIKVYQYQESLEEYIRIKQEWIQFVVNIAAELQLPIDLRQDALYMIMTYKGKYLDLLKTDSEISDSIKNKIKTMMETDMNELKKYDKNLNVDNSDNDNKRNSKLDIRKLINSRKSNNVAINKFGIKISELILNLVWKEELYLMELQKYEEFDVNIDLREIYELIMKDGKLIDKTVSFNLTSNIENKDLINGNIIGNSAMNTITSGNEREHKMKQACMPRFVSSKRKEDHEAQSPLRSSSRTPTRANESRTLRLTQTKRDLFDEENEMIEKAKYNRLLSELEYMKEESESKKKFFNESQNDIVRKYEKKLDELELDYETRLRYVVEEKNAIKDTYNSELSYMRNMLENVKQNLNTENKDSIRIDISNV